MTATGLSAWTAVPVSSSVCVNWRYCPTWPSRVASTRLAAVPRSPPPAPPGSSVVGFHGDVRPVLRRDDHGGRPRALLGEHRGRLVGIGDDVVHVPRVGREQQRGARHARAAAPVRKHLVGHDRDVGLDVKGRAGSRAVQRRVARHGRHHARRAVGERPRVGGDGIAARRGVARQEEDGDLVRGEARRGVVRAVGDPRARPRRDARELLDRQDGSAALRDLDLRRLAGLPLVDDEDRVTDADRLLRRVHLPRRRTRSRWRCRCRASRRRGSRRRRPSRAPRTARASCTG